VSPKTARASYKGPIVAITIHLDLMLVLRKKTSRELAQFVGDADLHIGIRADAEAPARAGESQGIEGAVAKIGLGDRAEAGDGATRSDDGNAGIGVEQGVGDGGGESAEEVEDEILEVAEVVFDVVAEDPEKEHIAADVQE